MPHVRLLILTSLAALFFTGCATFGSVQRANTMGKGNWQVAIEPGIKGVSAEGETGFLPDMTVAFRAGLSDKFDFGGRIGTNGYDLHMKYQFTDPESTGPILSLAPAVSVVALGAGGVGILIGQINIPLLIGLPVGEHQFVFGPRVVDYFVGGGGGGAGGIANVVFMGSSFAFAAKLGENFGIIPEVTIVYPIVGSVAAGGESASGAIGQGLLFEFKLGFQIGAQ